ncbi:hypothetical protein EAS64_06425 [Trebonia kvetii]|uniref:Uncharacterized protein n=1 Tax=Trebonia kvetii TaxID=2480626 RepID=A0A6P2CAJ0_9ACTN|nr:hypothetical protein [Trebonia kvetii]TVZ06961.1 hypothetical protein EAS64_06425 [Trebonia kvetii]
MEPSSSVARRPPAPGGADCAASRIALVTAHANRVLKITHPYVSDSGRWEATWTGGGSAVADTEYELLEDIAARLGRP